MQIVFHGFEWGEARVSFRLHWNEDCKNNPRQRGMDTGFQHRHPHDTADEDVNAAGFYMTFIQNEEHQNTERNDPQSDKGNFVGIEKGNDQNRPNIIEDGQRSIE